MFDRLKKDSDKQTKDTAITNICVILPFFSSFVFVIRIDRIVKITLPINGKIPSQIIMPLKNEGFAPSICTKV